MAGVLMALRNGCRFHHRQSARPQRTVERRRQSVVSRFFFSVHLWPIRLSLLSIVVSRWAGVRSRNLYLKGGEPCPRNVASE